LVVRRWQAAAGAAAGSFAADQAWKEYGGTTQLERETEIPKNVKMAIHALHLLTAFFLGAGRAGTLRHNELAPMWL